MLYLSSWALMAVAKRRAVRVAVVEVFIVADWVV
jgi:hypothetical protein